MVLVKRAPSTACLRYLCVIFVTFAAFFSGGCGGANAKAPNVAESTMAGAPGEGAAPPPEPSVVTADEADRGQNTSVYRVNAEKAPPAPAGFSVAQAGPPARAPAGGAAGQPSPAAKPDVKKEKVGERT